MIAKVQPARRNTSSPKNLLQYLTTEKNNDSEVPASSFMGLQNYLTIPAGESSPTHRLRGDVILSDNLAGLDTAAIEMEGTAANNFRCKDSILHYELSWPQDEHPTKTQWVDCAYQSLKALGYGEHQFVVVAHEDKRHFHIHVMVNKVHPDTFRVHNPHQNWPTLHKVARTLEAKYGWKHTPGLARWDDDKKEAVELSRQERQKYRAQKSTPTPPAAQFEHYQDAESLQTYIRREIAPHLHRLLDGNETRWQDVHALLEQAHLRLEKGEMGGYTVVAIDHDLRVKASDVFRNDFAGKANRSRTEQRLGPWVSALDANAHDAVTRPVNDDVTVGETKNFRRASVLLSEDGKNASTFNGTGTPSRANPTGRTGTRDQQKRDQRRAVRQQERDALKGDYSRYKEAQLVICKQITEEGKNQRQELTARLRMRKKEIRARDLTWPGKKILISEAVSQSVIEMHVLKEAILQKRRAATPKDYRTWVTDRASDGDARAAAQLRGWHYQDQRNEKKLEQRLEAAGLHIRAAQKEQNADSPDWAEFMDKRLAEERRELLLEQQIRATRIWEINRRTGDVSYAVNGKVSIVDRGKILTVLNHDEAAIVFGLEMSIKKYGTRLSCTGSTEWKTAVAQAVVRRGIYVQFVDPEIPRLVEQQQRTANPLQRQVLRLAGLKDRLAQSEADEITFENETDVYQLLSAVNPTGNAKQILQVLRNSTDSVPHANYGGMLTIQREERSAKPPLYRVTISPDKRAEITERLDKSLESTRHAINDNVRIRGREGLSR